jgi:hypothetical protein
MLESVDHSVSKAACVRGVLRRGTQLPRVTSIAFPWSRPATKAVQPPAVGATYDGWGDKRVPPPCRGAPEWFDVICRRESDSRC